MPGAPASIAKVTTILLVAVIVCLAAGAVPVQAQSFFYVDAVNGDDSGLGRDSDPWKTLKKVSDNGWDPGYVGGTTIFLKGTFTVTETEKFFIQLDKSAGNATHPLRITSWVTADHKEPATIIALGSHAINIYSWTVRPLGLGIQIDNLKIIGDGNLQASGRTTAGIIIGHDAPGDISWLRIYNVNVSGFTEAGIFLFRGKYSQNQTGWIKDVKVQVCTLHDNDGYPGLFTPSGSGLVLSGVQGGLVEDVEAYHNGAQNTNPGGGPVGIWAYDADQIVFNRCNSHDNLSQNNDGGGFDFDIGVTNSVMQNCRSYNNWGPGFEACALTQDINNGGATSNVTVKDSISENDGWGKHFASVGVFPDDTQTTVQDFTVSNVTIIVNDANCSLWGSDYGIHSALWFFSEGGSFSNVRLSGSTVVCKQQGKVFTSPLTCNSGSKPYCS